MLNLFNEVVFHRSMAILRSRALVYVHSAIYETSLEEGVLVFHTSMVNWRRGGYICPKYLCILLCIKHIQCSGIPYIYDQLEEGGPWYMCILLYVKLLSM